MQAFPNYLLSIRQLDRQKPNREGDEQNLEHNRNRDEITTWSKGLRGQVAKPSPEPRSPSIIRDR